MGGYKQMLGLGWSEIAGNPSCPDRPGYRQRCFRTAPVNGRLAEQDFARSQGCISIDQPCNTAPEGDPGSVWCCPPNRPSLEDGGEKTPPGPPSMLSQVQGYVGQWWFWGILIGAGVTFYFAKKIGEEEEYSQLEGIAD